MKLRPTFDFFKIWPKYLNIFQTKKLFKVRNQC